MARGQGKTQRQLIERIEKAGGRIIGITKDQHLRVAGPVGVATVSAHTIDQNRRDLLNTVKALSRYAGLQVQL